MRVLEALELGVLQGKGETEDKDDGDLVWPLADNVIFPLLVPVGRWWV